MSRASTALIATPLKVAANILPNRTSPVTPREGVPPSPGNFRHPRFTEIIKRQSTSSLTSQNIQNALINLAAIAATMIFGEPLTNLLKQTLMAASVPPSVLNAHLLILLLRFLFLANTIICLRPVLPYISRKDSVIDIPLTPSQRALLGLPPSNHGSPASATGNAGYVTPPRYRRDGGANAASVQSSPSALSTGRRSTSANYSTSPLSTSRYTLGFSPSPQQTQTQSARAYRRSSDSPFEHALNGGSLLQRAVTNDFNQSTSTTVGGRASLGANASSSGFGLSRSQSLRERKGGPDDDSLPGTPSPSGPKRQTGVNYKWLYDKGARLPRSESTAF